MSQRIIVGNLPPDITAEELDGVLKNAGVEHIAITLNNEGDKSKVAAVLAFEDIDRATADRVAARIHGMRYRDRTLSAYVPLFL